MSDSTQHFAEGPDSPGVGDLVDGRYRLEEPMGGGVTATTWRAHDPVLGRDVAIKLWTDASEDARRSQQDELGAARLLDPSLNELLDAGTHDGRPFLVREIALEHPTIPTPPVSAAVSGPTSPTNAFTPAPGSAVAAPRRRGDRVVWTSVAAIAAAAVLVVVGLVARPQLPGSGGGDVEPVAPTQVASFDPEGDGTENPDQLPALSDGDPSTAWSSDRYNSRQFGNLKPGLGLVFTLSPPRPVESVEVTSGTGGWRGQIYAADAAGTNLGDWGDPIHEVAVAGRSERFELKGRTVGAVLIWFTDLGPESNRLTIADVRVNASA